MEYQAHETAVIDPGASIGKGSRVWHWTHISAGAVIGEACSFGQNVFVGNRVRIGNNVKVQNNVSVYDNVTLEDDVFCGPSMVFTNVYNPRSEIRRMDEVRPTLVKRGATLGANCTIVCGVTIGRYAFVAAGAVVTQEVPDYAMVAGSPATIKSWMCECGLALSFKNDEAACTCKRTYTRTESQGVQRQGASSGEQPS